jgi:hypothetical protein
MPPRWRTIAWKMAIIQTLCKSLDYIYRDFNVFVEEVYFNINITPQVIVLESYLNRKTGLSNRQLFIVDTAINGIFSIYLSNSNASMTGQVHSLMKGRIIAGSNYNIIIF